MQPPTTFAAVAGGPPDAFVSVHVARRLTEHRASRWSGDAAPRAPLATSRPVRLALAARRLVTRPA